MHGNRKILTIITAIMFIFALAITAVMILNFRSFSQHREFEKAKAIALLVKDGLTAHMSSGTMSQRNFFLDNVRNSSGALDLWVFRTDELEKDFGDSSLREHAKDEIDKKAIKTGKIQQKLDEKIVRSTLRVTVPYTATSKGTLNCLSCHSSAKEGDVLGGISMIFDVDGPRNESLITIIKIFGITLAFIVIFILITNKLLIPYTKIIEHIKNSLKKANYGDYSSRIEVKENDKGSEAGVWLNTLFEKLEKTIGSIDKNIGLFVADRKETFSDPLEKSQIIIEDIARIYKFKRTIEQDRTKFDIYARLIKIFKEQLHIKDISLYEVDIKKDIRVLVYTDTSDRFCEIADTCVTQRCRAFRTNSIISSDDFDDICESCHSTKEYFCINYIIDENVSLVLNIKPSNLDELYDNKKEIGYIKNYLESARPVLQSKILTDILQQSNMVDGLTKLYNRKYMDIFMETNIKEYKNYAIAMLDIDYFKKVNDSYGHDAGDRVLKGLSEIFRKTIKKEDIAFRFGGEEFLVMMPNVIHAKETIQKIKDEFEKTIFNMGKESINKTISAGISYHEDDEHSVWQLIKYSDIALYEAKNTGRNKIVLYKNIVKED